MKTKTPIEIPDVQADDVTPSAAQLVAADEQLAPLFINSDPNDPVVVELRRVASLWAARKAGRVTS